MSGPFIFIATKKLREGELAADLDMMRGRLSYYCSQ